MEIKIVDKKDNALLSRTEIQADIEHFKEPTPTRAKVREKLAAMLSIDVNLIVIKKLDQTFGSLTKCFAVVYNTKDDLEKTEQKYLVKRDAKKPKAQSETKEVSAAPPAVEKKEEPAPAPEAKPEEKKE